MKTFKSSMTSIDKLKKINEMTKVLRQHGLSTDDAVKQSSSLYDEKIETNNSPVENNHSYSHSVINEDSLVGIKRMQNNIQERISHIENNVSNIIEKMNEMIKVIKDLETRPIASADNPQTVLKTETKIDNKSESEKSEETKPDKPRTGDFKPGEVDIMDYFNFSKR